MANKTLFASTTGPLIPATDTRNSEQAPAHAMPPRHALAQYSATGCFGRTFYATAEEQLSRVLDLCSSVEPAFVAKTAVYARERSYMKDTPALLCAWLSTKSPELHEAVFARVIDNTRMVRNYVQILRSGVVGRKSLGTAPKRLVRTWLATRDEDYLFRSSTGQDPSFTDILKMVHPKPGHARREAFYGYMLGRPHQASELPALVLQFERFKAGEQFEAPDVPFTMLSSLPLSKNDWTGVARRAPWQTLRMNLNTIARHGVFNEPGMAENVAERLRDAGAIANARVFPFQLLAAYQNCDKAVPALVREALQDAMELAIANVPAFDGKVFVFPDVSGSMRSPITGYRAGSTTAVSCVDVAALVAAAVLRKNSSAEVIPFESDVVAVDVNASDSVMTNATKLASVGGGGTNCSAPLALLNRRRALGDLVVFVSDNESWVDAGRGRGTQLMSEWQQFRERNKKARLVCVDIQPNGTTQSVEHDDLLNIGGFSDKVFETVALFAAGQMDEGHWVEQIEQIVL